MIRKIQTATAALAFLAAGAASADVMVDVSSAPTSGLDGFTTYTFSLTTDTDVISSVGASFNGPMNQINPNGIATIFNDSNAFFGFVGAAEDQDSQFLFNSGQLIVVPGSAEGDDVLTANFTGFTPFTSQAVAQVVVADGRSVDYNLSYVVRDSAGGVTEGRFTGVVPVPEPTSLALLGLGGLLVARRRRG